VIAEQPLSTYDPVKGCFVLKPMTQPTINAFHPDYVKTYMPELLSSIKTEAQQKANGEKVAKTTPMKLHIARPSLEATNFYVYQKAGMPKKGKKK